MRPRSRLSGLLAAAAVSVALASPPASAAAPATTSGRPLPAASPVLRGIDLERATIPDLQRAMNRGRLTSRELTAFYLHRIRRLNPTLRAVIATNPDALRIAAASDRQRHRYGGRSPLEGIPVLLKDNIDTRDRQPTTAGSLALLASRPAGDAFLVARLRAAGAVVIGKANLSEWANFRGFDSTSGWSAVGGQNNNPYVLDRNPCGSSSGSATGVAANLATVAIGTETDGSIVCPAGAQGVVGIKPTLGLVSRSGVVPISAQQDTAGPMAKHVVDAALTLSVLRGVDPSDPATESSASQLGVNYLRGLSPDALRGKRIGLRLAGTGAESDPQVLRVMSETTAALRRLGATVLTVELPYQDEISAAEYPALLVEFKHDINAYLAARPGPHPRTLAGLIRFNRAVREIELRYFGQEIFEEAQATSGDLTDPAYRQLRETARKLARQSIDETLAAHRLDAIIAPTNGPAWRTTLGEGDDFSIGSSMAPAVAGYPNITVPAGFVGPLPIGVSFIGPQYEEASLLALAYAFERGTQVRRPPTFLPTLPG